MDNGGSDDAEGWPEVAHAGKAARGGGASVAAGKRWRKHKYRSGVGKLYASSGKGQGGDATAAMAGGRELAATWLYGEQSAGANGEKKRAP